MKCTGICRGGPYNGRELTHFFADKDINMVIPVAIDMDDPRKRPIAGQQAATKDRNVKFGYYRFADDAWIWDQSELIPESLDLRRSNL